MAKMDALFKMVLRAFVMLLIACKSGSVFASVIIKDVVAQQRGRNVDIAVRMAGLASEVSAANIAFAVTNSTTHAALQVSDVTRVGEDELNGDLWTRHYVWDAATDLGNVRIDEIELSVMLKEDVGGVQLWEGGPYWAECNVGATKPEESGYYFWWGDTVGYKRNASNNGWVSAQTGSSFSFSTSNCPTYNKSNSQLQSLGYIDSTGNLARDYDAASAHLGSPWRMPTNEEFVELMRSCTTTWTTRNGVLGRLVAGKGVYSSKSIFLPVVGYGQNSAQYQQEGEGHYWSSTPYTNNLYAWYLYFTSGKIDRYYTYRYYGQPVRPVVDAAYSTRILAMAATSLSFNGEEDSHFIDIGINAVKASQHAPWDGKVDVEVQFLGTVEKLSECQVVFVATNVAAKAEISTVHIEKIGEEAQVEGVSTWYYSWSAAEDLGKVAIDNVELIVTLKKNSEGVQLWEGGPYWAKCNVGANKPEEYGYYFVWGETSGYVRQNARWIVADGSNSIASFSSSKHCLSYGKSDSELQSLGYVNNTGNLSNEHDAAFVCMGAPWRMPTGDELRMLVDKCKSTWTTRNGVRGCLVTGNGECSTNEIFLPAAGAATGHDSSIWDVGAQGRYWSSSPVHDNYLYAMDLSFDASTCSVIYYERCDLRSVRPVRGYSENEFVVGDSVTTCFSWSGMSFAHSVAYDNLKGATHSNPSTYQEGSTVEFSDPSEIEGYEFVGWEPAMITADMTGDVTVSAIWCEKEAQIVDISVTPHTPFDGKVDVSIDLTGVESKVANCSLQFAAINNDTEAAIPVSHIAQIGPLTGSGTRWTKKFEWDVETDLGSTESVDISLSVSRGEISINGVQLWENGPYWAECNVGATKPEEYGYYFWWGDTVGYKRNSSNSGWVSVLNGSSFSFNSGNCPACGKSNSELQSLGYIDSTGKLVAAHDAATAHLGAPWRMPTDTEFAALLNNCDTTWTARDGVNGRLITGRGSYSSKSIFLPAAGLGDSQSDFRNASISGSYSSSTPSTDDFCLAKGFFFGSNYKGVDTSNRYDGQSVRPVIDASAYRQDSLSRATTSFSFNQEYTVTFSLGEHGSHINGELIQQVKKGCLAIAPEVLPDVGYRFIGWSADCSNITGDVEVCALYEPIQYTIDYQYNIGSAEDYYNTNPTSYTVEDEVCFESLADQNGFSFVRWCPGRIEKGTTGDVIVQGEWESICPEGFSGEYDDGSLTWLFSISNGGAVIKGFNDGAIVQGDLTIPCKIGGRPTTGIADKAFEGRSQITSVIIPPSVVSIGASAFEGCTFLGTITIPPSVRFIGDKAFYSCAMLDLVEAPDESVVVGGMAFHGTRFLGRQDEGLVIIGASTYVYLGEDCPSCIEIPQSVQTISGYAFYACDALQHIVIHGNVVSIGGNAFLWCDGLRRVYVDKGDKDRVMKLMRESGLEVDHILFIEEGQQIYTVEFNLGENGLHIGGGSLTQDVCEGCAAITPEVSAKEGYEFIGWDASFECVTSDLMVNALWRKIEPEVPNVGIRSVKANHISLNPKVNIEVQLFGTQEELAEYQVFFAATNSATKAELATVYIERVGEDVQTGEVWTRHFVWDAAADLGNVTIDDVELSAVLMRVKDCDGVQLWENGPHFAKCNVGATKPEEYGYYFWWGETIGYKRNAANNGWESVHDGLSYSFSNCPTYGMSISELQSLGYIDTTGNLTQAHDAATAHLGVPWRMPTDAEFAALLNNCDTTWTTLNGVYGRRITGRGAYSSKSIFLPAAGNGIDSLLGGLGSVGYYWSSTPLSEYSYYACFLAFYSEEYIGRNGDDRYRGRSVRPVRDSADSDNEIVGTCTTHFLLKTSTEPEPSEPKSPFVISNGVLYDYEGEVPSELIIPDTVTEIAAGGMFEECDIDVVTIPASVVKIGAEAFAGESKGYPESIDAWGVKRFVVDEDNPRYRVDNGMLYDFVDKIVVAAEVGISGIVTLPSDCCIVGHKAFKAKHFITDVIAPQSLMRLEYKAFSECSSLTNLDFSATSLACVGEKCFRDSLNLKTVRFPSTLVAIGNKAFESEAFAFGLHTALKAVYFTGAIPSVDGYLYCSDAEVTTYVKRNDAWEEVVSEGVWQNHPIRYIEAEAETIEIVVDDVNGTIALPEGATEESVSIKIMVGGHNIRPYINLPAAIGGVIDLSAAVVKPEVAAEAMDITKGAEITLSATNPTITTAPTKPGLTYTLVEGATIESMGAGASKLGDGTVWTPEIKVKGGASAFYSIKVTK